MKPTHRLKVLNKRTGKQGTLGGGWLNTDGSVSIVLDPCVVIEQTEDLVFTLFPITDKAHA